MSLDFNHYMLLGIDVQDKRNFINENEDTFLPFIEGHYGIDFELIEDRESEKFMYFGKVLARGDQYEGIPNVVVDPAVLPLLVSDVAEEYEKLFNEACDVSKVKLVACTVIW